jgi:DNA-binding MarR family transcriptional regulator
MGSKVFTKDKVLGRKKSPARDLRQIMDDLRHIVRALRVSSRGTEKRLGISGAQLFVLQRLAEARPVSLGQLAERTHTDPSSVSVVVSRLVQRGLVLRAPSEEDARRAEVRLTSRGRALAKRAPEALQSRLVEALAGLPRETRRGLADGLAALVAGMKIGGSPRMFFEDDPSAHRKTKRPNRVDD